MVSNKKNKRCNCEAHPATTKATRKKKDGGVQRQKVCHNCGNVYLTYTAPNCLEARVVSQRTNPEDIPKKLIKEVVEGIKNIKQAAEEAGANFRTFKKAMELYKEEKKK